MKDNRGWNKCAYCGKFFSAEAVLEGKIKHSYTPDTSFSSEDESYFYHAKCDSHIGEESPPEGSKIKGG